MQNDDVMDRRRVTTTLWVSLVLVGLGLTWTFLGMRAVMDVGGSCADGGPYLSRQTCPHGGLMVFPGLPVALIAAFFGSSVAPGLRAPELLLPFWVAIFLSLGWNFWEYALRNGDALLAWVVCGALFWLLAAPAAYLLVKRTRERIEERRWWPTYAGLVGLGVVLGVLSFNAVT